jgi:glycosyltransferase involved in cell wall biosynthesis
VPLDADARRANLMMPDRYIVVTGRPATIEAGFRASIAAGADAVVLDAAEGAEPRFAEIAVAAGLPEARARFRSALTAEDRAALLAGAAAFVATDDVAGWPWRAVEAMTLGVPVVALDTGAHRDVVADGGAIVPSADIEDAVVDATGPGARRLSVLAADRSRAFSWHGAGERVWGLHADL